MLLVHVVTIHYSANVRISQIVEYLCHHELEMFSEQLDVQHIFGVSWPRLWKGPSEYRNISCANIIASLERIVISDVN
jgi:hypothetical protein